MIFTLCIHSCDAEPGALADYILALLKHNAPESDLRKELIAQLEEFLEKGMPSCDFKMIHSHNRRVLYRMHAIH